MTTENPAARAIFASTLSPEVHSTVERGCMQSSRYLF
jgi:hypothetical protein